MRPATALLLAGRRDGRLDALAAAHGVTHKCLVPVLGDPMLLHPLRALAASPRVGRILLCIDDAAVLDGLVEVEALRAAGRLTIVPAQTDLFGSITASLADASYPVIVTTADNVLLTQAAIDGMSGPSRSGWTDVAFAMARREDVLAAHPDGQRRFYRFADGEWSNCNLYWIGNRLALKAARAFRGGGQFAKHPARIAAAFGLGILLRFRMGWDSLDRMCLRLSARFGIAVRVAAMTDGALAIDIDNARTHAIAEDLLAARRTERLAAE
jgi:GTP:adenosylcobinamide-phosphate guanylyltransferase